MLFKIIASAIFLLLCGFWIYLDLTNRPKRICAWCGKLIRRGTEPATHVMCPDCRAEQQVELDKMKGE